VSSSVLLGPLGKDFPSNVGFWRSRPVFLCSSPTFGMTSPSRNFVCSFQRSYENLNGMLDLRFENCASFLKQSLLTLFPHLRVSVSGRAALFFLRLNTPRGTNQSFPVLRCGIRHARRFLSPLPRACWGGSLSALQKAGWICLRSFTFLTSLSPNQSSLVSSLWLSTLISLRVNSCAPPSGNTILLQFLVISPSVLSFTASDWLFRGHQFVNSCSRRD